MSTVRNKLIQYFTNQSKTEQATLDTWAADFKENPLHSLKWSDKVFESAAKKEIADAMVYMLVFRHPKEVENLAGQQFPINTLIEYTLESAMSKAKYPPRSTSVGSNMVEQEQGAAWAKAHERVKHYAGVDIDAEL